MNIGQDPTLGIAPDKNYIKKHGQPPPAPNSPDRPLNLCPQRSTTDRPLPNDKYIALNTKTADYLNLKITDGFTFYFIINTDQKRPLHLNFLTFKRFQAVQRSSPNHIPEP